MSITVKSYTSWQPLEEVIVGRVYTPEYFAFIKNQSVRSQLSRILEETLEDLDNLQNVIEQFGACVRRPDLPNIEIWNEQQVKFGVAPIPPLTPRD